MGITPSKTKILISFVQSVSIISSSFNNQGGLLDALYDGIRLLARAPLLILAP